MLTLLPHKLNSRRWSRAQEKPAPVLKCKGRASPTSESPTSGRPASCMFYNFASFAHEASCKSPHNNPGSCVAPVPPPETSDPASRHGRHLLCCSGVCDKRECVPKCRTRSKRGKPYPAVPAQGTYEYAGDIHPGDDGSANDRSTW